MIVYDEYGKPILHQLYLAYPNKNYIGKINFIRNYKPTFKFYSQGAHSIELDIYEKLNSNINPIYDQIEVKLLVEVVGIGWFTIISCDEQSEGLDNYKHISLESYETFLLGKQLDDINGVFALYDVTDVEHSILHICAKYSGWTIGHVDNDLIGKFRTFTLDSDNIYNFLMGDVSSSFKCIFKFNTYDKTINAYLPEHLGDDTDIFISNRNILQKYNRSSKSDKIVTKLKAEGGTGSNGIQLDIRDINPDGSNELINLDYYLPMMSEGLRNAWIAYQTKYNDYLTGFNTLINSWKNKTQEKIVLDSELKTLEMNRDTQDEIVKSYIYTNPTINSSTTGYQNYLNALNSYNSYVTLVANKKNQINNKEAEINNVKIQIDDFQSTLTTGNFTQTQLNELEMFLTEGDVYEDSTFTATDTMNEKDIIDMQLELRNNASMELYAASRPQYEISIEASNLYSIVDDISRKLSYDKWKQQLVVGNFITVKLNEYSVITLRVLEISLDYTSIDKMNIILSTKSKTDENEINVLLNNAHKTSGVVSLSKYGYDQASKISSEVREFMNSTLDATKNKVMSNPYAEFEVTPYGAMMRYYDESQMKYSDYQSMWSGYNLLFSSDGFKTAKAGIGLFVDPSNNSTYYGVLADVIIGQMVLAESLSIVNQNNKVRLDKNGASFVDCDISITRGSGVLRLSATDGIKYTRGEVNQFYLNSNGDIVFAGTLSGANGTFSGTVQAGKVESSDIIGSRIETYANNGYFLSSAWNGSEIGTWINETRIEDGEIKVGRTMYYNINGSSGTRETATMINSSRIYSNNVVGQTGDFDTLTLGAVGGTGKIIFDSNYQFRPQSTRDCSIGSSSYPWTRGYFKSLYVNGVDFNQAVSSIYPESNKTYYAYLNSSRELVPSTGSSSYPFSIGNSSYPWDSGYFRSLYVNGVSITNIASSLYSSASTSYYITLNAARELVPNTASSSTPFSVGNSSYQWDRGYFKSIYLNGTLLETYAKSSINSLYNSTSHYLTFNSSGQLIPNTSSSSYNFELGSSSLPWDRVNVKTFYQNGGNIGFFGVTPTTRRSVSKLSGTANTTNNHNKINEILTGLHALGLFNSP